MHGLLNAVDPAGGTGLGRPGRKTDAMHECLSRAVVELRARLRWGQQDLADRIARRAARMGLGIKPNQVCVSRWENCETAPSPQHRMVLARIASKNEHEDLANLFRAPLRSEPTQPHRAPDGSG